MTDQVTCPREVWAAARRGRRVSVDIQPDGRSVRHGSGGVKFAGRVSAREKVGDAWTTYVTIRFTPDGDLAPVELEAEKSGGEWDAFRAFHWREPADAASPDDSRFMYVGRVVDLEMDGVGSGGAVAREDPGGEVVA